MERSFLRTLLATLAASCCIATHAASFGTFDKAFAANSPWNSRPVSPLLGDDVVRKTPQGWFPTIGGGASSTQAFKAVATDGPMTVTGLTSAGIWDPDAEVYRQGFTVPHWPAAANGASGSDGECEVVDTVNGIIYSFWRLRRQDDGSFKALEVAWTALDGRGFGDPAHYMQGVRSAGVSTLGGLIRASEVNDGDTQYRHALAMSLDKTSLAWDQVYTFPATAADVDAYKTNTGWFPIGSLMMLPASFDTSKIVSVQLKKIAETLKTYGAYVVDRNVGTPFVIYVENGASFSLNPSIPSSGWDGVDKDLMMNVIRPALRRVTSAPSWIDGNGAAFAGFDTNLNLLSARGPWVFSGAQAQTIGRAPNLRAGPTSGLLSVAVFANESGRAYYNVPWARPVKGKLYAFKVAGGTFSQGRMVIQDTVTGLPAYDSGWVSPLLLGSRGHNFVWPSDNFKVFTYIRGQASGTSTSVQFDLRAVP